MSSRRVLFAAIGAIVVSLVALMISIGAYSVATNPQAALTMTATRRSIGENFRWNLGEVVDVQGKVYAYLGYEVNYGSVGGTYSLRLATWQNAWLELTYYMERTDYSSSSYRPYYSVNVTLSPYKLQVFRFNNNYLNATFFES